MYIYNFSYAFCIPCSLIVLDLVTPNSSWLSVKILKLYFAIFSMHLLLPLPYVRISSSVPCSQHTFLKSILILPSHLHVGLPSDLLP